MSDGMRQGIVAEHAVVYRGGGRRYFTKKAAARAMARAVIRRRCDCSEGDHITPGETCWYHEPERYKRFVRTLAFFALKSAIPAPQSAVGALQDSQRSAS